MCVYIYSNNKCMCVFIISPVPITEPLTSELIDTPVFYNLAPRPIKYRVSVPIPTLATGALKKKTLPPGAARQKQSHGPDMKPWRKGKSKRFYSTFQRGLFAFPSRLLITSSPFALQGHRLLCLSLPVFSSQMEMWRFKSEFISDASDLLMRQLQTEFSPPALFYFQCRVLRAVIEILSA